MAQKSFKLKDVCSISKGQQINGSELLEKGYPFFNGGINPSGYWKESNVNGNTVTISEGGNSCGYVNYQKSPFWCGAHCYFLFNLRVDSKFLYFYLKGKQNELMKLRSGVCMPNIKKSVIENFSIPDISGEKQKEITNVFEHIYKTIENDKEELTKLDEIVKSRFIEMFDSDLKGNTIRLGDLCEVITKGTTPTTLGFDFVDEGINFVKIECITENYEFLIDKMLHITEECDEKLKRSKLKENDVLFSIAGAIGRTAIVSSDILPANTNQALAIIRLKRNSGLDVRFLNEMLHSDLIIEQVDSKKSGVAQTNLSLNDIGNFKIITPPIEKQLKFANFVQQIDKSKFLIQKRIDLYQELLDKKMSEYFD